MLARLLPLTLLALASACFDTLDGVACTPGQIAETGTSGDTVTLSSGLKYINVPQGEGAAATWCKTVFIHYDAYRTDGTKFDSSRERGAIFVVPGAGEVIEGVEQGLIGLRPGSVRRLIIPPHLGYGSSPRVDPNTGEVLLPANSTIIFDVEVLAAQTP
jgi:FKBP-type peptidyl-prolyl cis-trans isomerase